MADFIDVDEFEEQMDPEELDNVPVGYREFRDAEGIPVHNGLYVEDVNELEVGEWDRTGQHGAFVNLYGNQGLNDMQVHELEPGGQTTRQRHVYEAIVYVSQGQGLTAIGHEDDETIFEWEQHAMFLLPPNVPYRHVNSSENADARLIADTPLPQYCNMFRDHDFFFDCEYDFWDDVEGDGGYGGEGQLREGDAFPVVWDANFIPDVKRFENLETWHHRGAGGISVLLPMPGTDVSKRKRTLRTGVGLKAHLSEFPVGTYKKAHRHGPGAFVGILAGEGYSLLWEETMDQIIKVDWKPGSVVAPPALWYHQHFNTGEERARYFAMHSPDMGTVNDSEVFDPHREIHQIEYVDEDPDIRELFDQELAEDGLSSRMPPETYTDPDYEIKL